MYITGLKNATINMENNLEEMFAEPSYYVDIYSITDKLTNITDTIVIGLDNIFKDFYMTNDDTVNSDFVNSDVVNGNPVNGNPVNDYISIDNQESKISHMNHCMRHTNCLSRYFNKHHFHNRSEYNELFSFLFLMSVIVGFYSCSNYKKRRSNNKIHIIEAEPVEIARCDKSSGNDDDDNKKMITV